MNSNLSIIKNTKLQTSNGVYICTGLWMGNGLEVTAFDLQKYYAEPTVTEVLTVPQEIIKSKLEQGNIKIL